MAKIQHGVKPDICECALGSDHQDCVLFAFYRGLGLCLHGKSNRSSRAIFCQFQMKRQRVRAESEGTAAKRSCNPMSCDFRDETQGQG